MRNNHASQLFLLNEWEAPAGFGDSSGPLIGKRQHHCTSRASSLMWLHAEPGDQSGAKPLIADIFIVSPRRCCGPVPVYVMLLRPPLSRSLGSFCSGLIFRSHFLDTSAMFLLSRAGWTSILQKRCWMLELLGCLFF